MTYKTYLKQLSSYLYCSYHILRIWPFEKNQVNTEKNNISIIYEYFVNIWKKALF